MEYKNLCKIEDISQSKILVGLIKDFIEIKKLSESKLKQARERLK